MNWRDTPIGIIQNDELLNALTALWKARYDMAMRFPNSEAAAIYDQGFVDGLNTVAQVAGIDEFFEDRKQAHMMKAEKQRSDNARLIVA